MKKFVLIAVIVCLAVLVLSIRARAKAVHLGDLLMEPQELTRGYHRSVLFEPLGLRWTVWYVSSEPDIPTSSVSVDLLGRVQYGSKYFVDRAMEVATP